MYSLYCIFSVPELSPCEDDVQKFPPLYSEKLTEGLPQPFNPPKKLSGKVAVVAGEKLQPPEKTLRAPDGSFQPVKGASAKSPGEPPDFS